MNSAPEKIDLDHFLRGMFRSLRHMLIWGIILCILCSGLLTLRTWYSYTPRYTAKASFTVQTTNPLYASQPYYNATTAEQMAKTFPYILTSGVLSEHVQQTLGIDVMPTLNASVLGATNIFTLTATSTDPQLAYQVLQAVVEEYPVVAEFVVGPTVLTMIDDSGVPTNPVNSISYRQSVIYGLAIGFVLWLMISFLYWITHQTVSNEAELKRLVNLPYLGNVPMIPGFSNEKNAGKCPVLVSRSDKFGFSESIRLLRIRVERAMEKEKAQVLLVTSTIANEGKTTLAINLATALAQRGKRVLLMDCDLRNPSVGYTYGEGKSAGLSELLQGKAKLDDIIYHTKTPNLYALFAGKAVAHPERLMRQKEFRELIQSGRATFDYIILDTSPCAMLADAADICNLADCVLLTVRQNHSCHWQVREGVQILEDCGRPILGTVLSMTAPNSRLSNYYHYHSYYSGYGYSHYHYSRKKSSRKKSS